MAPSGRTSPLLSLSFRFRLGYGEPAESLRVAENYQRVLIDQGMGYLSVCKSPLNHPKPMSDILKQHPNAAVIYRQLDAMGHWYNFPGRGGTRIHKLVQDAIQDAVLSKKTLKVALDEAAEAANRLIRGRS